MNQTLKKSAVQILKDLLAQCTEPQKTMFKRMYSHTNMDANINEAVDNMQENKIDWAISQVERTVEKNKLANKDI